MYDDIDFAMRLVSGTLSEASRPGWWSESAQPERRIEWVRPVMREEINGV
jgi:hypothetical protein